VPSEWEFRRHHGRSPQAYVNQKLQIQLRLLMMSDITLETCWTINVLWNNKIPLLSCNLLVIATSHTTMHGSMNIKDEKYTIFLRKFINKIIFNSKHFNYNIHFLNIVSVRWRPLLSTHSLKRFWKFCITSYSMLGEIAATSSLMFCFKSTVVLGFVSYTLLLRYPQRNKYCD